MSVRFGSDRARFGLDRARFGSDRAALRSKKHETAEIRYTPDGAGSEDTVAKEIENRLLGIQGPFELVGLTVEKLAGPDRVFKVTFGGGDPGKHVQIVGATDEKLEPSDKAEEGRAGVLVEGPIVDHWSKHSHLISAVLVGLLAAFGLTILVIYELGSGNFDYRDIGNNDVRDFSQGDAGLVGFVGWFVLIGLVILAALVLGKAFTNRWPGILIDSTNRMSLSVLQVVLWTVVIIPAIPAYLATNLAICKNDPNCKSFKIQIPTEAWALLGMSGAVVVLAGVNHQLLDEQKRIAKRGSPNDAKFQDIFMGDPVDRENRIDISRLQILLLTIVVGVAYATAIGSKFGHLPEILPLKFPEFDEGILAILFASNALFVAAGYTATKGEKINPAGSGQGST